MEVESGQDIVKETKKENQVDPSIQCLFSRKPCKRKRLKGFDFCHKHILEDKNSPFQQCSFIIKSTDERCTNPAPKAINKKTFCLIHTRDPKLKKAHDEIMRRNHKRKLANRKAAIELRKGSADASTSTSRSPNESKRQRQQEAESSIAPEMEGIYKLQDMGGKTSEVTWFDENESDAESVDSEEEDPLRHAGVWTLEEALKICRDKMIRKRSLYLEQYKRLTFLLKERKRKHLLRVAGVYQSDVNQMEDESNDDRLSVAETTALGLYQHMNGTELLLDKQAREKRSRGLGTKTTQINRCLHSTDNERCPNRVLPFTKFCVKHICCDPDQKLYKKCGFQSPDINLSCDTPVVQISRMATCDLHASLLPRFSSEAMESILNPEQSKKSEAGENGDQIDKNDVEMKSDEGKAEENIKEFTAEVMENKKQNNVSLMQTKFKKDTINGDEVNRSETETGIKAVNECHGMLEAEKVKSDPEAEKVKSDPEAEKVKSDPEAEKVKSDPEAEKVKSDPEAGKVKSDPEVGKVKSDPEAEKVKSIPEAEKVTSDPEAEKVKSNPEAEKVKSNPEAEKVKSDPEAEKLKSDPEAEKVKSDPEAEKVKSADTDERFENQIHKDKEVDKKQDGECKNEKGTDASKKADESDCVIGEKKCKNGVGMNDTSSEINAKEMNTDEDKKVSA